MIIDKSFRELFNLNDEVMIITHKDMDGLGCHILLEKCLKKKPLFKYATNNNSNKLIKDFIYPRLARIPPLLNEVKVGDELRNKSRLHLSFFVII